jgi:hypothetical protein
MPARKHGPSQIQPDYRVAATIPRCRSLGQPAEGLVGAGAVRPESARFASALGPATARTSRVSTGAIPTTHPPGIFRARQEVVGK